MSQCTTLVATQVAFWQFICQQSVAILTAKLCRDITLATFGVNYHATARGGLVFSLGVSYSRRQGWTCMIGRKTFATRRNGHVTKKICTLCYAHTSPLSPRLARAPRPAGRRGSFSRGPLHCEGYGGHARRARRLLRRAAVQGWRRERE